VPRAKITFITRGEKRGLIWDAIKDKASFFADGRMAAGLGRIRQPVQRALSLTLFGSEEAFVGSCTKTTICCANIAAGIMLAIYQVSQLPKVNQKLPQEQRVALMKLCNLNGYKTASYSIYSSPANSSPSCVATRKTWEVK
jgi:hypothetical protein